jgi:hypothetical protein
VIHMPEQGLRATINIFKDTAHLPREQGLSLCKDSESASQEADEGRAF